MARKSLTVLAVDTSTPTCSVALATDRRVVAEILTTRRDTHSIHLMPMVEQSLKTAGRNLGDIDAFAVVRGPGSFTGLRIGLGAVKGLAASMDKPVVGVSSLEALAFQAAIPERLICAMLDARKDEVYTGRFRLTEGWVKAEVAPTVGAPEDAIAGIDEACVLIGNGALLYADMIQSKLGDRAFLPPLGMHLIRASSVAWLGLERLRHAQEDDLMRLAPEYIRPSDAQIHMNRKAAPANI